MREDYDEPGGKAWDGWPRRLGLCATLLVAIAGLTVGGGVAAGNCIAGHTNFANTPEAVRVILGAIGLAGAACLAFMFGLGVQELRREYDARKAEADRLAARTGVRQ
jgi:hypothetical protein